MLIKYVGPAAEVSLSQDAGGITFRHGQPVEVPDELAANLLEQGTFVKAKATKPKGRGSAASAKRGTETR